MKLKNQSSNNFEPFSLIVLKRKKKSNRLIFTKKCDNHAGFKALRILYHGSSKGFNLKFKVYMLL
jgi:hypothetical protein